MSDYVTPLGAITAPPLPHFLPTHNCHCAPLVLPEFDLLQLSATYDADGSTYKNWTGWLPGWKSRFELRQIGRSTRKLASYDERSVFDGANASGNGARGVARSFRNYSRAESIVALEVGCHGIRIHFGM